MRQRVSAGALRIRQSFVHDQHVGRHPESTGVHKEYTRGPDRDVRAGGSADGVQRVRALVLEEQFV